MFFSSDYFSVWVPIHIQENPVILWKCVRLHILHMAGE